MQQFTSSHFSLARNSNGQPVVVSGSLPGIYALIIVTDGCTACQKFNPIFQRYAQQRQGVLNFGLVNVGQDKNFVPMFNQTSCRIQRVPMVIIFLEGRPKFTFPLKKDGSRMPLTFESLASHDARTPG